MELNIWATLAMDSERETEFTRIGTGPNTLGSGKTMKWMDQASSSGKMDVIMQDSGARGTWRGWVGTFGPTRKSMRAST